MDYNRVALFIRVVAAGSFTAAALELGLPKSSVSRGVMHLEKELGVRLLQRTTRKIGLTEAGQAYYDAVRPAVLGIDEADAAVKELGAEPRGPVRITAPPDMGTPDLAALLTEFNRKYPGICVELSFSTRTVDLVAEGFDLAIRAGKLEDSTLIVRRIGMSVGFLFAAPAYLRRRGRPETIADLGEHDWVLYRAHAGRATIKLAREGESATVDAKGVMIADELTFCRAASEAGAGIALLPIHIAEDAARAGRLEHVLPEWQHTGTSLNVVLPSSRHVPARVALVRDLLVAYLTKRFAEVQRRCDEAAAPAPAADKRRSSRSRRSSVQPSPS
jgi:DNA-binding transcriptional LysR family regulator